MSLILALLLAIPPAQQASSERGPVDLVAVHLRGAPEAAYLFQVARDPDDHRPIGADGVAWIYADDSEQERLSMLGFRLEVLQEDLPAYYAARAAADPALRSAAGSMGGFRTLAEILQEMDRLAAAYPSVVSPRYSLGASHEGRQIWAMRVSDNPTFDDPAEPVAWFDAIHHAREPMSGESLLLFADYLASRYGSDPLATRLVDSRNIVFIPCANPDGYEYNRQTNPNGGGMWRKNRRANGGGSFGVDMNRNYDWEWGPQWSGSSSDPNSSVYRGPSPFSEPETQALRDELAVHPPGQSISAHTYSDLWLYSWGYDTVYTPDNAQFRFYGQRMTGQNGWPFGTVWEILYIANGASVDWHYGAHGTFAYTPEIGNSNDGFWPAPARIPDLFQDVLPGYLMVTMWTGGFAERTGDTLVEVSGNGDPWPDPGETWDVLLELQNAGVDPVTVQADLSSPEPKVTVLVSSATASVPAQGSAQSTPLRVQFANDAVVGQAYTLDLDLTFEGATSREPLELTLGRPRLLAFDDMEADDFGWQVSNATNYSWERAIPQQTTSSGQTVQPGTDNPAGSGVRAWVTGAAAGGSAGTNDVDGITVLTSPRIYAGGFQHLELEYARWFANLPGSAQDDRLRVEVSNDGGASWALVEETANRNFWETVSFDVESLLPLSNDMRLRLTASDQPNNDLTEAVLDDVVLRVLSDLPTLGVWGETARSSDVRLVVTGPSSVPYSVMWSFRRGAGTTTAGMDGLFYLTGNVRTVLSGSTDAEGEAAVLVNIPNRPVLASRTVHLQAALDQGGALGAWSNLLTVVID